MPYTDHELSRHISNDVSITFHSAGEVLNALKGFLSETPTVEPDVEIRLDRLRPHLSNLEEELAIDTIVSELNGIELPSESFSFFPDPLAVAKNLARAIAKTLGYRQNGNAYAEQKFPGSSIREVRDVCDEFEALLGMDRKVTASRLEKDLYVLR